MRDESIITSFLEEDKALREAWNNNEISFTEYLEKLNDLSWQFNPRVQENFERTNREIENSFLGQFLKEGGYAF